MRTALTALAVMHFSLLSALPATAEVCPLSQQSHHDNAHTAQHSETAQPDIVDTAVAAGQFKTLVAAVKAAGLVETLKSSGPFTVFAPADSAFAKLPTETIQSLLLPENKAHLTQILTYHVVPGRVMASDVVKLKSAKTVLGQEVSVKADKHGVMINGAKVLKTDILCDNGVIHVIDSVLMPKEEMPAESDIMQADIVDTAVAAGSFNTLVAAVKAAGLVETLKSPGPFTVFAPTDEAFAKIPAETIQSLLLPENKDQLVKILTYHVVPGKVLAADVVKLNKAKTVLGQEVSVAVAEGGVSIDKAKVLKTDIVTSNGVIHVIDSVLMPR